MTKPRYESIVNAYNLGCSVAELTEQTEYSAVEIFRFLKLAYKQGQLREQRIVSLADEYMAMTKEHLEGDGDKGFELITGLLNDFDMLGVVVNAISQKLAGTFPRHSQAFLCLEADLARL